MKDGLLIHLDYCLTPTTAIHNAAIVVQEGKILAVGGFSAFIHTENYHVIDMTDCYVMPGMIDTHLYGAAGFDCMHADENSDMSPMSKVLADHGVTSFVPTTQSCDREKLLAVVRSLVRLCDTPLCGAVPCGITVEGPYISPTRRGAHPQQFVRDIDLEETEAIIAAGAGRIKILTFAPEQPESLALIELLKQHDIIPCLGHTVATERQVRAAVNAGALRCSHLYNGMEPLENRKLGLAALALIDERIWVEIIMDGVHIHPGMIDLACRSKSKDKIVGISNCTIAAGLDDGVYRHGLETIVVSEGKAMLRGGTLAGSVSFLDTNYRYMLAHTHMTPEETAACFTLNPARSIGLTDRGEIKPGKRADLVVMDARNHVQMTLVNGNIVYDRRRVSGDLLHNTDAPNAGPVLPTGTEG